VSEGLRRVFVLGGARSGKSAFAERLAAELGEPVLYVATATAVDEEMAARIRHHQARRPAGWRTLEAPRRVSAAAAAALGDARTLLLEDLTLLLSNYMLELGPEAAEHAAEQDLAGLLALPLNLVLMSNEVGLGLVPEYPLGRAFRDALGRLNQLAAARTDEVQLLVAGIAVRLKPSARM
jgi:adenosylcobinamide kinase/adenosylcobinamide-phosphate guanylyltransferase